MRHAAIPGMALALACGVCLCPRGAAFGGGSRATTVPAATGPAGSTRPATAPASAPATQPADDQEDSFDLQVQRAIDKAVRYLWSVRGSDGTWEESQVVVVTSSAAEAGTKLSDGVKRPVLGRMTFPVGTTSLACFALLESGVSTQDPRMAESLRWLAKAHTTRTYSLGMRANAWEAAARQENRFLANLRQDVRTLVRGTRNGAYSYDCPLGPQAAVGGGGSSDYIARVQMPNGRILPIPMSPDNSNSQFGLLGVWAGAKAAVDNIPVRYWEVVHRYWCIAQNPDGGWGYYSGPHSASYPSMTVAGLASLYVCNDNFPADRYVRCDASTRIPAVDKGMAWLDKHIQKMGLDAVRLQDGEAIRSPLDTYYLFGVERVALASGFKYLGGVDWYKAGAERIMAAQAADGHVPSGGWGRPHVGTALAVLFLARGRHPVLFNKLKHEGDWSNRPRDLAGLTHWLSRTFERTVNWQIITWTDPVEAWHDAPLLYVCGSKDPGFSDRDLRTLCTFVYQGGTIFSCTECNGGGFRNGMREAYRRMFPDCKLEPLAPTHPLFQAHFKVQGARFSMVSNGVRPLAIHCDFDLPLSWQQQSSLSRAWTHQVAANIVMYVTGSGAFRPRAATHWPAEPESTPLRTVKLARLKHEGNFDPEPLAYERLRRLLGQRERIRLEVSGPMAVGLLPRSGARLATLTGTGKLVLSPQDRKVLDEFVTRGGTLLIDAAGGDAQFDKSAREILQEMYPNRLRTLATVSEPLSLPKLPIVRARYRGEARARQGRSGAPELRAVTIDRRPAILYSREDITGALVGCDWATCDGYEPQSAYEIMRNVVIFAGK